MTVRLVCLDPRERPVRLVSGSRSAWCLRAGRSSWRNSATTKCVSIRRRWRIVVRPTCVCGFPRFASRACALPSRASTRTGRVIYTVRIDMRGLTKGVYMAKVRYRIVAHDRPATGLPHDPGAFGRTRISCGARCISSVPATGPAWRRRRGSERLPDHAAVAGGLEGHERPPDGAVRVPVTGDRSATAPTLDSAVRPSDASLYGSIPP